MSIADVSEFSRLETESVTDIEAMLEGTVFHVTKRSYWPGIQNTGALLPNSDGLLSTSFGSSGNSFFRNLGCICVFDYRAPPEDALIDYRSRCWPFQPASPDNEGIAILVFNPAIYPKLLPWTLWKEQEAYDQMVVPHVEAGHPGPITLDFVDRVILLRRREDPRSLPAMLRTARKLQSAD